MSDLPPLSKLNISSPTPQTQSLVESSSPPQIASAPESPSIPAHLSHSPATNSKISAPFQFGSRHLSPTADPYTFNAWDHVPPPSTHLSHAETQYALQRAAPVSAFDKHRFNSDPAKWWNRFYANNTANFFKDRKWLQQEFPVLAAVTQRGAGKKRILEVGAGAGNTAFPVLKANQNEELMIHACDFSSKAVEVMKASPSYDERYLDAQVWDVASETLPLMVEENSIDVVLLIFIFSALSPSQWAQAVRNVYRALKPGGQVCFRDYGRGDLAQVRFRKGRWMEENFYVRGDGTRVYFFGEEELRRIWGRGLRGEGEEKSAGILEQITGKEQDEIKDGAQFDILELGVDRRMLVNRRKELKMYRCWMQGRFRKPLFPPAGRER